MHKFKRWTAGVLAVSAQVTEKVTGITLSAKHDSTKWSRQDIEIKVESEKYYKPEFAQKIKVRKYMI